MNLYLICLDALFVGLHCAKIFSDQNGFIVVQLYMYACLIAGSGQSSWCSASQQICLSFSGSRTLCQHWKERSPLCRREWSSKMFGFFSLYW